MKLILVRHGETEWNKVGRFQGQGDIALNSRGLAQARETAGAAVGWNHTAVYSSPLCRTMQVAQEIARLGAMPVVTEDAFKELNLGDLEGITGAEMRERWPEVSATWRNDPQALVMPNGESLVQLQERAWQGILELERSHDEKDTVVVVSHNFAIRTIIAKLMGMPLSNFHRLDLSLSSICTFQSDQRGRRLTGYNFTCHLSPENR